MQDKTLYIAANEACNIERHIPGYDLQRTGEHDVLEVESLIYRKDAPGALEQKEGQKERTHARSSED